MKSLSSTVLLQEDLHRISSWCSTWLLKLNSDKCLCVHFGLHNPTNLYLIGDDSINNSNSVVDLGVLITSDLKRSAQCQRVISKAQRMLSMIKLAFKHLDAKSLTILYKAFVLPLMDYCCVAWCPFYAKDIDALEKVQRRFTKLLPTYRYLFMKRLLKYDICSLYARRLKFDLLYMYNKIVHGLMDLPLTIFPISSMIHESAVTTLKLIM